MPRSLIDMSQYFISNKRLQVFIPCYVFHTFLFIWQQSRYSIWALLHPLVNFSTGLRLSDQMYNKSNWIKLTLLGILIINLRVQNVCIIRRLGHTTKGNVAGISAFLSDFQILKQNEEFRRVICKPYITILTKNNVLMSTISASHKHLYTCFRRDAKNSIH